MSVSSMATHAMARRFPASEEARVVRVRSTALDEQGETTSQDKVTQALEIVMAYVPTEILTLYVATVAALQSDAAKPTLGPWLAFGAFLIATPVVVWLIYAAKFKARTDKLPWKPSDWPKWEMISAIIGYLAWAYALPSTPFRELDWYSSSVAGILVMMTAAMLGLLTPLIHPESAAQPTS